MPTILLPLLPGTLPPNACYDSEQERLVAFMAVSSAVLAGGQVFYNFGDIVPTPENRIYPWLRTTDNIWYTYSGDWLSPVGPKYHLGIREWWSLSLVDLQTYDGGDTNAPSNSSGPMWVEDTAMIGRSPMHPGTVPGSDPPKLLSLGEDYGVGSHENTMAEMPEHQHAVKYAYVNTGAGMPAVVGNGATESIRYNTELTGEATPDPYSIVHPVRGLFCIKWSGRAFRKA